MKNIIALLSLAVLMLGCTGVTQASGCPDGSDPIKSISADGSYFVYNCGGSSVDNSVTVVNSTESESGEFVSLTSAVQQSTTTGNWFPPDELLYSVHFVKKHQQFRKKSYGSAHWQFADLDNDGVQDFLIVTPPMQPGVDWSADSPECNTSLGACYSEEGSLSLIKVKKTGQLFLGVEVTDEFFIDNNPIEMRGTDTTDMHIADFNGDGVFDVFQAENVSIDKDKSGKNDMLFLSQPDGTWLESTATHVTGTWDCSYCQWTKGHGVKEGKGLINFSHGASVGDIDGDGDIDIVVTTIVWHGWTKSQSKRTENGYIYCYENQGDGHMVVRQCGDQAGSTGELGDVDNDGDLDLVWGGKTFAWVKEWDRYLDMTGCVKNNFCNGPYNGILLNDGTGNFYERGFEFDDMFTKTTGFAYQSVPVIGVIDLDGDDDLDVIRNHVGNLYSGAGMTIEENVGNGQFKTVLHDEFCAGNTDKNDWMKTEGGYHNCATADFKFGDFNKDGLVDIYLDGQDVDKSNLVQDGAIYMSTGKFTYDIVLPNDEDYPLKKIKLLLTRKDAEKAQSKTDEDAEVAAAIAKRKAEVAAAKAKRLAEEAAKAAETDTVDTEQQSVEDEIAEFEAELAAELGE